MHRCSVPQCNNSANTDNSYSFPAADSDLEKKWTRAITGKHNDCKHVKKCFSNLEGRICSTHFKSSDFKAARIGDHTVQSKLLKEDAIPSLNVECKTIKIRKVLSSSRFNNVPVTESDSAKEFILDTDDNVVAINTQLKLENNRLNDEHDGYKEKLGYAFLDKRNIQNDSTLYNLTGVKSDEFTQLLATVHPHVSLDESLKLNHETQMMLVLSKMRLNISDQLLSLVYSLSITQLHDLYIAWLKAFITSSEAAFDAAVTPQAKIHDDVMQGADSYLYADFVGVTTKKESNLRVSRSSWKNSMVDQEISKVLCILEPSGEVAYLSASLSNDFTPIAALRQIQNFDLSKDKRIFWVSTEELITRDDIELGVFLENDVARNSPLQSSSAILPQEVKETLNCIKDFTILSEGLERPFSDFHKDLVKVCAFLAFTPKKSSYSAAAPNAV